MGYFLGSGKVWIGDYVAGVQGAMKDFHCPTFELKTDAEYAEHKNSNDVIRVLDASVAREQMASLNMVLDQYDPVILAMALGGEVSTDSGTSFSAKTFPTVAVNDTLPIPGFFNNLASLAITDSAGSPVTLTLNTHYSVDLKTGLVTFLNLASFTQPFKAAGATTAAGKNISVATKPTIEKFIIFDGTNYDGTKAEVQVWRVQIPPTTVPIKSDGNDFAKFEFSPKILADPSAPFSSAFGKYARITTF